MTPEHPKRLPLLEGDPVGVARVALHRNWKHAAAQVGDALGVWRVVALIPPAINVAEQARVRCVGCGVEKVAFLYNLRTGAGRTTCSGAHRPDGRPSMGPPADSTPPIPRSNVLPFAPLTREQRRSRRKRAVRASTITVKRMTQREINLGRLLYPADEMADVPRPQTRADCAGGERPCPFVSCKHHLYLDVSARTGAIKLNFPDLEVWEMTETCALDVADRGGTTLEEVGAIMNLTRERIRQVEVKGLAKLQALKDMMALRDYVDEGPVGKRRLPLLTTAPDEEEEEEKEEKVADADVEFDVEAFAGAELDVD